VAARAIQYGALPWRHSGAGIEVLLISSRETKRWVIPKGWPIGNLAPYDSAAREAFEEAGIGGQVGRKAIGRYEYDKRLKDGKLRGLIVEVYLLEVMVQYPEWPEQGQRTLLWSLKDEAAGLVEEPDLAKIIRKLK
jgi:8-oxo-dGTP pyrophosphatase MutT (NUDIX family)